MTPVLQADSTSAVSSVALRTWTKTTSALLLAVLVISTVVIIHGIHRGEFSYNVDETQHAMTGFFVADLIRDHPLRHPVEYAYQYYAQYPALSGVIHWPPFFYLFEGVTFLLLGPSVVSARLVILAFSLLGITFWFLMLRELQNQWLAAAASIFLACAPSVLLFEKAVMLEMPCLAFCLPAIWFWTRYLLQKKPADVYLFALFASAAALTKQNAVYLIPFCLFSGSILSGWRLFVRPAVLKAMVIGLVLSAPFYTVVYLVHWKTIAMDLTEKNASKAQAASFYWKAIPDQIGWVTILLAIVGVVTSRRWATPKVTTIMLSWIAACYVTFTLIGHKEPRYAMYWIPPFTYFALGPLFSYFRKPPLRIAAGAAAVVLIGSSVVFAWSFQRPYIAGYEQAAERVTQISKAGVILYDAPLAGNFIFFLHANDAGRHFMVLRKALYATRLKQSGGSVELVHSPEEIQQLIRDYGVRFFVVSEGNSLKFDSQRMLRDLLKQPNFREIGTFDIQGHDLPSPNLELRLYENMAWTRPAGKFLRIKMLTLNHDIVLPMERFTVSDTPANQPASPQPGVR
ncbi:MAG TPA: glycosyltransferase family 39 protein [Dongiaceae bacterium]|nr:glycosyltransferase family 39 protein [Dongiaceae bacterium]